MDTIIDINFGGTSSLVAYADSAEIRNAGADLYVADSNTASFLSDRQREKAVILPPGEENKTFAMAERILARAVELCLDRSSVIMGLGGGVVCDMTALAASLYMRGCRVVLVPTTLLAMVDAAMGGKTGVDYGNYKNMIGTFFPAEKVLQCPEYLASLPEREYLCGLAEVIKTAILGDGELLGILENNREDILKGQGALLREMITRCALVKGRIVQEDLKEKGVRACLNLGHTFGHALETVTGFSRVSHGEGVAWGMGRALSAALKRGDIDMAFYNRIRTLLQAYGYRLFYDVSVDDLIEAMGHDKKIQGGTKRFILPGGVEKFHIIPLEMALLREVLEEKEI